MIIIILFLILVVSFCFLRINKLYTKNSDIEKKIKILEDKVLVMEQNSNGLTQVQPGDSTESTKITQNTLRELKLDLEEKINAISTGNSVTAVSNMGSDTGSNTESNTYIQATMNDIGFDINFDGSIIFNKPVRFKESVTCAANAPLTVLSRCNIEGPIFKVTSPTCTFTKPVTFNKNITVDQNIDAKSNLTIEGTTTMNGITKFIREVTANSKVTLNHELLCLQPITLLRGFKDDSEPWLLAMQARYIDYEHVGFCGAMMYKGADNTNTRYYFPAFADVTHGNTTGNKIYSVVKDNNKIRIIYDLGPLAIQFGVLRVSPHCRVAFSSDKYDAATWKRNTVWYKGERYPYQNNTFQFQREDAYGGWAPAGQKSTGQQAYSICVEFKSTSPGGKLEEYGKPLQLKNYINRKICIDNPKKNANWVVAGTQLNKNPFFLTPCATYKDIHARSNESKDVNHVRVNGWAVNKTDTGPTTDNLH